MAIGWSWQADVVGWSAVRSCSDGNILSDGTLSVVTNLKFEECPTLSLEKLEVILT